MTGIITKDAFVARHSAQAISAKALGHAVSATVPEAAGLADGLQDGKSGAISGSRAASRLFEAIDRYDSDGRSSTITTHFDGRTTTSGKILRLTESLYGKDFGAALMRCGRESIARFESEQDRCMNALGLGLLYGDTSRFARKTEAEKRTFIESRLREAGLPNSFYPWKQVGDENISGPSVTRPYGPDNTACVDWVLRHVGNAYKMVAAQYRAAGNREAADRTLDRWMEIFRIVRENDVHGEFLCAELQKDGWEAVFWADDITPSTGSLRSRSAYANAASGGAYERLIYADDFIVNFKAAGSAQNRSGLEKLASVPFWIGIAHGAYHVFCGRGAVISESHQSPEIDERRAVENTTFDDFGYHEGVLMIPPGAWPRGEAALGTT